MTKRQIYLTIIFGIIFSLGLYDYLSHFKENRDLVSAIENENYTARKDTFYENKKKKLLELSHTEKHQNLIDQLTDEQLVINFVKKYHALPDYYLTKSQAKEKGWNPSTGNLCDVLPNKAIGGDKFGNREGKLPPNNEYYEADVNYNCGKRNADRIIFTKNGDVWLTKDHYKTFIKQ